MIPPHDRSYWNAAAPITDFPPLREDIRVDIAIMGGGIVGLTTARVLKDMGLTVALLEARSVGRQVTGKSTAKVTSQHQLVYQTLERNFGERRARLYAEAQEAGVRKIRDFAIRDQIDCDIETKPAYTYTCDDEQVERIEKEVEVASRLGLPARLVHETDLPFEIKAAVCFDGQAQFHPTKYAVGLAATIPGGGCHVFENSRVTEWEPTRVVTSGGSVTARHVVMATHLPLGQVGGFYAQAYPKAEPVIVARIEHDLKGMYLSAGSPSHSLRTHRGPGGEVYGIAAGNNFKPGHTDDERASFQDLEDWLRGHFHAGPIVSRWVNEDYRSMDSAPFIGWSSSSGDRYLIATGFNAWGISNGTAAGMILADLATGNDPPWLDLFDATRVRPIAGGAEFIKENAGVATHLVGGYLSRKLHSVDELEPGEAAILKLDGKNMAAFRDEKGCVHCVSAVCSHMGCLVGWNETDRTWDCACHGSRFDLAGEVIHGPATQALGSGTTG